MKTKLQSFAFGVLLLGATASASAQSDITSLFKAGTADMNKLVDGYMKPAGTAFAAGLGSNWYNTAATHSLLGFDITIGASVLTTPTSERTFSLTGLSKLTPVGATTAPTFTGKGPGVNMQLKNGNNVVASFTTPEGVSQYIPAATLQASIGLPLGTDISVRYSPELKFEGVKVQLWGLGIKHNIKQWIPVVKLLPFDASIMAGYTKFKQDYGFPTQLQAADLYANASSIYDDHSGTPANQGFSTEATSVMANLIISKKIAFFTPYVGFGLNKVHYDLGFNGVYPILGDPITSGANAGKLPVKYINDPVKVSNNETLWGATAGFRLKMLAVIALHAQYTFQKYPTASVGFGINFR